MVLVALQKEIALCEELVARIRFDKNSFAQHYKVGLFVTGIQKANAIFLLLKHGAIAESRQLLRSSLEISIELELLKQDKDHIWNAQVSFAKEQLKTLSYARMGNPFLHEIARKMNIAEQEAIWKKKLADAKQMGGKHLRVSDKFYRLKRSHEYEALYASLSKSVHSSYSGVIHDAFEVDQENGTFDVALYSEPSLESVELVAQTACGCLLMSREAVGELES
jgi:hypothetical protein